MNRPCGRTVETMRSHVDETESGCWEWRGKKTLSGYGWVTVGGKLVAAHRWMWTLATGQRLVREQFVCHRCDNPPCVNPAHLFLGTNLDNAQDRQRKGRGKLGPRAVRAWNRVRYVAALATDAGAGSVGR